MRDIIFSCIAAFFAGCACSMGIGGGSVMLLYLTLIERTEQIKAQGVNLLFFIPCALAALCIHIKNKLIDKKLALKLTLSGVLGVIAGTSLAGVLGGGVLQKLFGVILLIIGVKELFVKKTADGCGDSERMS